jgi:hypothetical protein
MQMVRATDRVRLKKVNHGVGVRCAVAGERQIHRRVAQRCEMHLILVDVQCLCVPFLRHHVTARR